MNIDSKISLIRGETKVWKFQRKDGSGSIITTMPDEVYCTIKANYDDDDYIIQKTYGNEEITYSDGWWFITLSAAETLTLNPGKYVIDVKVITDSGATYVVHPQTLAVIPNVTDEVS